ncbi:choice-of-anchor Q domain-containing protein [Spirosoma rhododendri]|uniref:Ig-like domain-containing protein n=1 Tax=Spirosoma rhododendri TaxID=2728024 RepID=A0A7L5DM00_9BACT|nr:choice-of-anchor Q domain-containing protein [Spirosoma rhododendri]QJD79504.1 hypothetical protein HH216_14630 [Spirosoma rhododendri]
MKNKFTPFYTKTAAYLLGTALWLLSAMSLWAQTVYVTPTGAGQQTGADWPNALPGSQLQATLAAATEGTEFRLAGGIYKPSQTGDRGVSFYIPSAVKVLGGYLGSGANPDQRIDFANTNQPSSTILSGDIDNDNIVDAENTNNVVLFANVNDQTRLDGVVITGGYASGNVAFPGLFATSTGGAGIYNYAYMKASSPTIANCTLTDNYTTGNGGALFVDVRFSQSPIQLINTDFLNNRAAQGGAIYYNATFGQVVQTYLTYCRFVNNTAQSGGAVYLYAEGDQQRYRAESKVQYINCVFQQNTATSQGGALYTIAKGTPSFSATSELINCTLSGNVASQGGAIFSGASPYNVNYITVSSIVSLKNCILWNNGGANAIVNQPYTKIPGSTSDGLAIARSDYGLLETGVTQITDAQNTNNRFSTVSPFSNAQSLELSACSPAINAGLTSLYTDAQGPSTDIANKPRLVGSTIDIGAYEFQGTPAAALAITQQPASQSSVVVGATVETTVGLNTPADSYAWYKDGSLVSGQTSATLRLTNVQIAQAGSYLLVATSACNSVTSTAFSLSVTQPLPPAQRLAQLWLINADNNQPIQLLTPGLTIDLSKLPSRRINIQARTEPSTVGSVVFQLSGQQTRQQVETLIPYALFGDDNKGNYLPWTPAAGNYRLTATPYSSGGGTGTAGTPLTVTFTVIDPVNPQRLAQLLLINADTDQPIQQLTNGQQLDLSKLPTKHLAIQALTDPVTVGSVVFALSGQQSHQQTETLAPYALFGDDQGGHYYSWTPPLGSYTLTATPYSGMGGTGSVGTALSVSFTVIESATPAPQRLAQFLLINADTDQPIQQLTNGQQLDLAKLPTRRLAIQALTDPVIVGSVVFALSGQQGRQQTESIAPYALFGDDQGNFLGWTPSLGSYVLTATPYSSVGGTGVVGMPLTVSFTVINSAAARLAAGGAESIVTDGWLVRVLGNPVVGSEVLVEVSGAQDQPVQYTLTTTAGTILDSRQVFPTHPVDRQTLHTGTTAAGVLLLQVSTPTRRQVVKVLKSY